MEISNDELSERSIFISIYIALYESFSDYVIDCTKQLFNANIYIKSDQDEEIKKQDEIFEQRTKSSKYKYTKFTQDGYTQWLSPEYDKQIKNKEIKVSNKNKSKILFKSIMFFIDKKVLKENDFDTFLEIWDIRNDFVHKMAKLTLQPIEKKWKDMFNKLIYIYKSLNNYWCKEFELEICAEDIPKNIKIDFDNVITTDLYNLLVTIDLMLNTNFVKDKKWMLFRGLYEGMCLPIIEER